jgi:Protein of unknown function (DUF3370)
MLPFFSSVLIAQATPAPKPAVVIQPQEIRPLPGQLDSVLVFNSNSPEVVQTEGILLSTFAKTGKTHPEAHLDVPLKGRFDVFTHHISNKVKTPENTKTLYIGILVHNTTTQPVTVDVLQAASYLSQPDAPFIPLPAASDNSQGTIFAGPGDRATNDVLRGLRQANWPAKIVIPPGATQVLFNAPIPAQTLTPPINGRSTLAHLRSTGEVRVASLALFAKTDTSGQDIVPTLEDWQALLNTGTFAGPRDKIPTPPGQPGKVIYGRVAGVARGSRWSAQITDPGQSARLTIPVTGQSFSYPLSTVERGSFGTGQIQSAPMVARYADTAYVAHGNYGIQYSLTLPLYNPTKDCQTVSVRLQTPLKTDEKLAALKFNSPPPTRVFFRGTVRLRYQDDYGAPQARYVHLVQFQGQQAEPLVKLDLKAGTSRLVQVDFLYPPDATPPQVLTVQTEQWMFDPKDSPGKDNSGKAP